MKVGIFSRTGACFPGIISTGLSEMFHELGIENEIIPGSIPFLMRLLPLSDRPKRWNNNLSFRLRNKLAFFIRDRRLIRRLQQYDAIVISECYANAFWKNYFAVETFRLHFHKPVISYTEAPLNAAPVNRLNELETGDYDETRFDYNLFVSERMEVAAGIRSNQAVIGMNIVNPALYPEKRERLFALLDFDQPGYETFRAQQVRVLTKMGIETVSLKGRYPIEEIRKIYRQATLIFLSFPETIGLPIAECLACGTVVASPDISWPMAWREDSEQFEQPGKLPACFLVYSDDKDLEQKLGELLHRYDPERTPVETRENFVKHYDRYFRGNKQALAGLLKQIG